MSLKRDTLYNLIGNGVPLLAAAITIPFLLKTLGAEKFGVLTLIWGLIGYFGLFDFGVGRALTYEVSRRLADENNNSAAAIRRVIKAGLVITTVTGLVGCLIVLFVVAPFSGTWFKLSALTQADAKVAFAITAIGILPTTVTSGLRGALEGFGHFAPSNVTRVILGALMFLVPAAVVMAGKADLYYIATGLVFARLVVCGLAFFLLRHHIDARFDVTSSDIRPLLGFGVWVTISGIVSPLMVFGDRFFISAVIGAHDLAAYAIPQEGLQRLLIIPAALATALLPRMAGMSSSLDLADLYHRNMKRIGVAMFLILVPCALLAKPVLSIWISPAFAASSETIVLVLCLGLWFNSLAQMPMTLLHAVGRPKLAAVSHLIELPLYILMIVGLSKAFGITGAAMAWSLRVVVDFLVFNWFARQALNVSGRGWATRKGAL
ncbi:flippase [Cupriavidus metallidurans]|jgi:O-antigen/teichoic acid export membrane protein|uniref:flippase n=1 Tax=Cupriavidus metallidurans TaxID=119219 RepID=UPI000CE0205D|nr:flippase [Cupriavidus metallidurans]AVA36768.1 flippase [Cupriavidus metallidurans]